MIFSTHGLKRRLSGIPDPVGEIIDISTVGGFVDQFRIIPENVVMDGTNKVGTINGSNYQLTQGSGSLKPLFATSNPTATGGFVKLAGASTKIAHTFAASKTFPLTFYMVIRQNSQNGSMHGGNQILSFGDFSYSRLAQAQYYGSPVFNSVSGTDPLPSPQAYSTEWALVSGTIGAATDYIRINNGFKAIEKALMANTYPWLSMELLNADVDLADVVLIEGLVSDTDDLNIRHTLWTQHALSESKGRFVALGDSIVRGQNAVWEPGQAYIALAAAETNNVWKNLGISGAYVKRNISNAIDFDSVYLSLLAYPEKAKMWVYIAYMTNDSRDGGPPDGSISQYPPNDTWKYNLKTPISALIEAGYTADRIIIGTAPYMSVGSSILPQYVAKAQEAATELGCRFYDAWSYTETRGGDTLLDDGVHPTTAGHRILADGLKEIMSI